MKDLESGHDLIVVGGGPAGCATALGAARRGLRVLLLDRERFPRDKVCGDAITPLGVSMLRELDLLDDVERIADERLPRIALGFGGALRSVALPTPVLVVHRRRLDALLLDRARPWVDVREGWTVDGLRSNEHGVCGVAGRTDQGARFAASARAVVGADGASSVIARLTGCRAGGDPRAMLATRAYYRGVTMEERTLEFHFLPELAGGYLWIFPAGADRCNVGVGMTADNLRRSKRTLRALREASLASASLGGRFAGATQVSGFEGGTIPFAGVSQQVSGAGFVLVGDAAGLGDPFWGDGIDTALASGVLAAAHLVAACRADDCGADRLAAYARGVSRVLGRKLASGLELQRAASHDATVLRGHLLGA